MLRGLKPSVLTCAFIRFQVSGVPASSGTRHPRKLHFGTLLSHVHLKGIGGPGAPHVFRLERLASSGLLSFGSYMFLRTGRAYS